MKKKSITINKKVKKQTPQEFLNWLEAHQFSTGKKTNVLELLRKYSR